MFLQLPIAQIYEWLALKHVLIKRCKKLNVLLESETTTQMVVNKLFFILSCVGVDRKYRFQLSEFVRVGANFRKKCQFRTYFRLKCKFRTFGQW